MFRTFVISRFLSASRLCLGGMLLLLLSMASNAEETEGVIYREVFSNDTGQPIALDQTDWQVHRSGKQPASSVHIAAEEGRPADLDPVEDGKTALLSENAKKLGYLSHAGDPGRRAHLYWTEAQLEMPSDSMLIVSWHQKFDKGRDGNRSVANTPLVRQSIARVLVRIGGKWFVSRRATSVYQENPGVWEAKKVSLNGGQLWSEIDFNGREFNFGFRDVPALPAGTITAIGLQRDEAAGAARIDSFQVRRVDLKIPETPVEPDIAGTWPQYKRNSHRSGDAPEEELSFPLRRVCAVKFPAPIYASPAVVDGKVFIQDGDGHAAAIDYKTGGTLWTASLGGVNNFSSPAVSNSRVYIGSTAGFLAILDARTGQVLKKIPAEPGIITAPAVTSSGIYFSTMGGKLVKLNESDDIVWTFDGGPASLTEFAVRGNEILFCGGGPEGGSLLIRIRDLGDEPVVVSSRRFTMCPTGGPVFGPGASYAIQSFDSEGGRFEVGSPFAETAGRYKSHTDLADARITPSVRGKQFFRGDACFTENAQVLWRVDRKAVPRGGFHSSPALSKDHMIVGTESGRVQFIPLESENGDSQSRREPEWTFRTENAGKPNSAVSSSIAVADGRVVFGCEDGILYVLGPGEDKPVTALNVPPAPKQERVSVRANDHEWHTVGGDMGYSLVAPPSNIRPPFRIKWRTRIWSSFKGPMIVAEGKVFAGGRLGQLTALDADTGRILWRLHHGDLESRPGATYAKGKVLVMRGSRDQHNQPNAGGGLWCHEADTGELVWRADIPFAYHFNADGVTVKDNKVLAAYNGGEGALEAVALDLDTGREIWKQRYADVVFTEKDTPIRTCTVLGKEGWFVSIPGSLDRRGTNEPTGATVGIDPDSGRLLWKTHKYSIHNRSRISYRNGILMVFGQHEGYALKAATGEHLWTGEGHGRGSLYMNTYYQQALTDDYLESEGQRGIVLSHACSYSVAINGLLFGHERPSSPTLVARAMGSTRTGEADLPPIVWKHHFLSRACPAPTPAYGRLYYGANGEGTVYCFEPVEE